MPFSVVLDTCVLSPTHLRDTLLRLAERGLYRAMWSADIVDELRRNLIDDDFRSTSVDHLLAEMAAAFPDAEVSGYRSLIDGLTCDPKDRHVLAAGVRADAAAIVTFNVRDFPATSVEPFEIGSSTPTHSCSTNSTSPQQSSPTSSADKRLSTVATPRPCRASSTRSQSGCPIICRRASATNLSGAIPLVSVAPMSPGHTLRRGRSSRERACPGSAMAWSGCRRRSCPATARGVSSTMTCRGRAGFGAS